jgi:hypothetical protein
MNQIDVYGYKDNRSAYDQEHNIGVLTPLIHIMQMDDGELGSITFPPSKAEEVIAAIRTALDFVTDLPREHTTTIIVEGDK